MAVVLKDYEFKRKYKTQYPWDEWADGEIRKLKHGEDFETDPRNFRVTVYQAARARGQAARCHQEGKDLVVQFYDPPKKRKRAA